MQLIADSGYGLTPVLLQPILDAAEDLPDAEYTNAICKLRAEIEMTYGQFKSIFRCCNKENLINYQPKIAEKIIKGGVVLYNFKKLNGYIKKIKFVNKYS